MKRKFTFSLIGTLFAILLLIRMPATMSLFFLPKPIQLAGVSGTLWNGHASALGLGDLTIQEDMTWSFQPKRLLKGNVCWEVTGNWLGQTSRLLPCFGFSGMTLDDIELRLPLAPFTQLDGKISSLKLGGNIAFHGQNLRLHDTFTISGQVDKLFSGLAAETLLGNYPFEITFSPQHTGHWKLETHSGILKLDGEGTLDVSAGKLTGKINMMPRTPIPGLSSLLSQLPQGPQGYTLTLLP